MKTPAPARLSSREEPRPPHDTLVAAFEAAAKDDAPFVTFHGADGAIEKRAGAALDRAMRFRALLLSRGVLRGDRVAVLLPSGHAFVEALVGTMLAGAVPVPLATPMTFGCMKRYLGNTAGILEDCDARVTVTYKRVKDAIAEDAALRARLGDVLTEADLDGVGPMHAPLPSLDGKDAAFLQYTSGTTGRPKGAVISHRALVSNAAAIAAGLGIGARDVGVSWLPLYHDMGLIGVLLTSICHPYPVHVMSPESFVMRPSRWPALVSRVRGTLSAAPNFAYDMCAAKTDQVADFDLSSWRVALNGAEPVHAATARRFADKFAPARMRADAMLPVYGMAESTLAVTFPDGPMETLEIARHALEEVGLAQPANGARALEAVSVGRPVAGTRVEVVDESGHTVFERVVGEIRVAGASLMDGYFRNDAATEEVLRGGWLKTGDLGFVDRGRLFVTGRAKELIIKGGRNLYPYDVERIATEIDGVRGAAAFAQPNEATGTDDLVVVAETVHADDTRREAIAKEIRGELLAVLGVKADRVRLCGVGALPRTSSGKIRRKECARLFAEEA